MAVAVADPPPPNALLLWAGAPAGLLTVACEEADLCDAAANFFIASSKDEEFACRDCCWDCCGCDNI